MTSDAAQMRFHKCVVYFAGYADPFRMISMVASSVSGRFMKREAAGAQF